MKKKDRNRLLLVVALLTVGFYLTREERNKEENTPDEKPDLPGDGNLPDSVPGGSGGTIQRDPFLLPDGADGNYEMDLRGIKLFNN